MDNYQLSRNRAQAYFLGFDQQAIIRAWGLAHDAEHLYTDFLGRPYAISRRTGQITRCFDGKQAGFSEVLSIFDLLCHESDDKYLSGKLAPVNSLRGGPKAGGVDMGFHRASAERFDREPEGLHRACRTLGGKPMPLGDIGYQFPLFADLTVTLKFYHSDEDFPATITLLWDENTLMYIHYETVFYIAGFLMEALLEKMSP